MQTHKAAQVFERKHHGRLPAMLVPQQNALVGDRVEKGAQSFSH
jgi:hypothetical protein